MKDHSCLDGIIKDTNDKFLIAYDKGYNHAIRDTIEGDRERMDNIRKDSYERGVKDLWESVCKFMDADIVSDKEIWGCTSWDKFAQLSPSEVIERLKEYDEKHNCIDKICNNCKYSDNGMVGGNKQRCASCYYDEQLKGNTLFEPMETDSKIEVGDVVKRADIDKSLVIIKFTEEGWALGMNEEGNISDVKLSVYKKTGKHFEQIAEVFNSLKDDTDA